jgi:group I intron endonuclease
MNSGIYLITNNITGKQYVGQSIRLSKRFWRHKNAAKTQNPREAFCLHKAIAKHGVENFKFDVILYANDPDYLNMMEQKIIDAYKTMAPFGYNLDTGGVTNRKVSEETKLKLSLALKGKPCPTKGKPHTEETKQKIALALKGKRKSEQHIKNASEARKGFKHSEETKVKLKAIDRSYVSTPEHREKLKAAWAAKRGN